MRHATGTRQARGWRRLMPKVFGKARQAMGDFVRQRSDEFKISRALEDVDFAALDRGWEIPGGGATELDAWDRHTLEASFQSLYFKHDIVKNVIDNYVHFIVGQGFTVTFRSNELQSRWDALEARNQIAERIREAVRMTLLLGNWFHVLYPLEAPLKLDVRDLDPSDIVDVVTAPTDDEVILSYTRKNEVGMDVAIPSQNVIHWHINKIGRNRFGRPLLEPALKRLSQFDKLVEDQLKARRIKGMFHLVRYLSKRPEISLSEIPPSSAVIEAHDGHKRWEPISKDVDSSEAWRDGLAILQRIASTVHLPVYFLLMDVSSTSSSEMHIESIPIKVFKNYQQHFARTAISPMVQALINEHLTASEYEIVPEPVDIRTTSQQTQDTIAKVENAIISRRTAQTELGYDPDKENRLINEELGGQAFGPDPLGTDRFGSLFNGGGGGLFSQTPTLSTPSSLTDTQTPSPPLSSVGVGDPSVDAPSAATPSTPSPTGDTAAPDAAVAQAAHPPQQIPLIQNFNVEDSANFLMEPPPLSQKILAVDDGFSSDAAYLVLGLTPDGYVVVVREQYELGVPLAHPDGQPSRVSSIVNLAQQERVNAIVVDPTASELMALLAQQKLPVTAAQNKVVPGFQMVDELAASGRLKLVEGLERLPNELKGCRCKLTDAGFVKKPHNRSFHGLDALRYGIVFLLGGE